MEYHNLKASNQDVLLTTNHDLDSVVEVYFNENKNVITELKYLSNDRVRIYQYELDSYLTQARKINGVEEKLTEILKIQV